jgi:hypothetical protein
MKGTNLQLECFEVGKTNSQWAFKYVGTFLDSCYGTSAAYNSEAYVSEDLEVVLWSRTDMADECRNPRNPELAELLQPFPYSRRS